MSSEFMEGDMSALRVIDIPDERPALSLELPGTTTFGEWLGIGRRLRLGSQALNWHIGDWWKFGVSHWGEDETRKSAQEIWGVEGETARVYGWVAEKFAPVNRLTDLTFTHYQRAASLPQEDAQRIIARAANEGLSVRDVQRAVQAIKAVNDPEPPTEQAPSISRVEAQQVTTQSMQAKAIGFAEDVVELCENIEEMRRLKKRESDMLTRAHLFVQQARGRRETYQVPETFELMFREHGRVECERIFGVARVTINHWLIQCGKRRLIDERAAFVRFQRDMGHPASAHHDPDVDLPPIDEALHAVAKQAAHFLRVSRYGGWTVTANDDGTWLVGTVRRTSDELIAMAERQGFDSIDASATLQRTAAEGVEA